MKQIQLVLLTITYFLLILSYSWAQEEDPCNQTGESWSEYGDPYHSGPGQNAFPRYLHLEGPGNLNPGNDHNCSTGLDTLLSFVSHFDYVLFDQSSFADRSTSPPGFMTSRYFNELYRLMAANPHVIAMPYFSYAICSSSHPWFQTMNNATHESFFLHSIGNSVPSLRISWTEGGNEFFLMDITNPEYRAFYKSYIDEVIEDWRVRKGQIFRAIYIDNVTVFPPINSSSVPQNLRSGNTWRDNMMRFLEDLRLLMDFNHHGSVRVICNCLGRDSNPSLPPVFGPNHGLEFLESDAHLCDGGHLEDFNMGFYNGAGYHELDTLLSIMQRVAHAGKIFLGVSSYTRNLDGSLEDLFGISPHWTNGDPIITNNYRVQYAGLARFLLALPSTDPSKFGWSFVPGETRYQTIPYYKPWDENVGHPIRSYTSVNGIYTREFDNCIVFVNGTPSTSTLLAAPFGTYYYYGPGPSKVQLDSSYTLRSADGIVFMKGDLIRGPTEVSFAPRDELPHVFDWTVPDGSASYQWQKSWDGQNYFAVGTNSPRYSETFGFGGSPFNSPSPFYLRVRVSGNSYTGNVCTRAKYVSGAI